MLNIPLIALLGAFGGFLNHLYFYNNSLVLPRLAEEEEKQVLSLGFLAELLLGIGGALVAAFLLVESGTVFQQAAIALLGGFGGGGLLAQNAANLERQRAAAFKAIGSAQTEALKKLTLKSQVDQNPELSVLFQKLGEASTGGQIQRLQREALMLIDTHYRGC